MNPPYQRKGHLWSDADKGYLIDSILNGFDIPKLYMADFNWGNTNLNKSQLPFAIIDGKQRLQTLFDFFEGKLVLNEDFVFYEQPKLKIGGMGLKDLRAKHPELAERFEEFNLSVMSVLATDEHAITELFVRLNRSKPLTGAELRNAMSGAAPQIIRKISESEFFSSAISFGVTRGEDKNAAAKILAFEYSNDVVDTKRRELDKFAATAHNEHLELAGRRVLENLNDMSRIFLPKDMLLKAAGLIPVYYWFVRSVNQPEHAFLRSFLVWFESERKALQGGIDVDLDILNFEKFNRSTNDAGSHEARFKILTKKFVEYKRQYAINVYV